MSKHDSEGLRTEYQACVDYHTSLVNTRFTIAGFFVTAFGVMINAWIKNGGFGVRELISISAFVLTICVWMLELRSRALFTDMARRGGVIERYWRLSRPKQSFFNRMHRRGKLRPDPVAVFFFRRWTLPNAIGKCIRHSFALDLMYAGSLAAWIVLTIAPFKGWMPCEDNTKFVLVTSGAPMPSSETASLHIELESKTNVIVSPQPLASAPGVPTAEKARSIGP